MYGENVVSCDRVYRNLEDTPEDYGVEHGKIYRVASQDLSPEDRVVIVLSYSAVFDHARLVISGVKGSLDSCEVADRPHIDRFFVKGRDGWQRLLDRYTDDVHEHIAKGANELAMEAKLLIADKPGVTAEIEVNRNVRVRHENRELTILFSVGPDHEAEIVVLDDEVQPNGVAVPANKCVVIHCPAHKASHAVAVMVENWIETRKITFDFETLV